MSDKPKSEGSPPSSLRKANAAHRGIKVSGTARLQVRKIRHSPVDPKKVKLVPQIVRELHQAKKAPKGAAQARPEVPLLKATLWKKPSGPCTRPSGRRNAHRSRLKRTTTFYAPVGNLANCPVANDGLSIIDEIMSNFVEKPDWSSLPRPTDDGAARHLLGRQMASVALPATDGQTVNLAALPGRVVIYAYPRTGVPELPSPDGWDSIPGARGCTPQSCAFKDHYHELRSLGVSAVFGLSTQDSDYQRKAASRLHLPFALLSDDKLRLTRAMNLPTFTVGTMTLLKRFTLIVQDGRVQRVFYPVFPPDQNAAEVVAWLAVDAGREPEGT